MTAGLRAFFLRHPLFATAVPMVAGVIATEWAGGAWPWAVFICILLSPLLMGLRLGAWCAIGGIAASVSMQMRHAERDAAAVLLRDVLPNERFEMKLMEDARVSGRSWSGQAKIIAASGSARELGGHEVWLSGPGTEAPVASARVRMRGDFLPAAIARNPGEFDEAAWLRREGWIGVLRAQARDLEMRTSRGAKWRAAIRRGFRDSIIAGLDPDSQPALVIRAVVTGDHPRDAVELIEAFRLSGTMHVFCVSGLHVGMVGLLGWVLLSRMGVSRRGTVLVILPLMFGYTWLTGSGAPAVRASVMAAVFLGAFVFRRRPDGLNALGAVLSVMLLWDGRMLFQPGVQLSYGVVLAIILGVAMASRLFGWLAEKDPLLPLDEHNTRQRAWLWLRRKTAQSLAVSTAAWAGSTPLTAYHFGLVTPASIPATVVQIPIIFCLLGAALVSATIHPVAPWAARGINQVNARLADASVAVSRTFAEIPGGHFRLRGRETRLVVHDLPRGAGAAVFASAEGGAVLIDCGDARSFRGRLLGSLRRQGIRPDAVVLTHPDGGHLGGGAAVWESLPIRQAILPVAEARSPAFRDWRNQAPLAGVETGFATLGAKYPVGGEAWIEVVHSPMDLSHRIRADDRVMVPRLHWDGWKILFTSDAGHLTERRMMDSEIDLTSDVIVAGKHRLDAHLSDEFLDAVNPKLIIASNTHFPAEEKLDPAQLASWRARGIQVIDQSVSGAATITVDAAGRLRVRGFLCGKEIVLTR